jgi:hypothetical protein
VTARPFRYPLVARALFATLGASFAIGLTDSMVLLGYGVFIGVVGRGIIILFNRTKKGQGREGLLF